MKNFKYLWAILFAALLMLVFVLCILSPIPAYGQSRSGVGTELPPLSYQDNPFTYEYGNVQKASIFQVGKGWITNLTVQPIGVYTMYPGDSIALCGDHRELLDFTSRDTVVIIYSRRLTRINCHQLVRIDIIQAARAAGSHQWGDK